MTTPETAGEPRDTPKADALEREVARVCEELAYRFLQDEGREWLRVDAVRLRHFIAHGVNAQNTLTARVREVEEKLHAAESQVQSVRDSLLVAEQQLTAAMERAEKVAFVLEAAQAVGDDANEWTDGEHVVKSRFVHALRAALAAEAPTEGRDA